MNKGKTRIIGSLLVAILLSVYCIPTQSNQVQGQDTSIENPEINLKRKTIDPELYQLKGPTQVIGAVKDDFSPEELARYVMKPRLTPSLGGFRILRGIMNDSAKVEILASNPKVLTLLKDKKLDIPQPEGSPTPSPREGAMLIDNVRESLKRKFEEAKYKDIRPEGNKPEILLKEVIRITGAQDVWTTYGYQGDDITIAIVDTGVDYGALGLGYWDRIARDASGNPAAFDADGQIMAYTTIDLTKYVDGAGDWRLPTTGLDPVIYYWGYPYYWSDFWGTSFPADVRIGTGGTGIVSISGHYRFGVMYQSLFFGFLGLGLDFFPIVVADSTTAGVYDTVYVDLSYDWSLQGWLWDPPPGTGFPFGGWPPDYDFTDEPHYPTGLKATGNTLAARDFSSPPDEVYELSAGSLGYFLDVWWQAPDPADQGLVLKPIDPDGFYVVFHNDFDGHGTSCANSAAGRDYFAGAHLATPGIAPGAKVMGVIALMLGDVIEGQLWAAGFDLVSETAGWYWMPSYGWTYGFWSYTGDHKADIISNSWGWSAWAYGLWWEPWYDLVTAIEDALTVPDYLQTGYPGTIIVHAGGNGGAGYGTFTEPGYGFLTIGVGASTSFGSGTMYPPPGGYWDDIISWSAKGPNPVGAPKPDVVNVGAWAWVPYPVSYWLIWYILGAIAAADGELSFDYFGGTSMATPLTAGSLALLQQAYEAAHSPLTPQTAKNILKSTAQDLGYDIFSQGSGRVDCLAAVRYALNERGITVATPATWSNVMPRISLAWNEWWSYYGSPFQWIPPSEPLDDLGWFTVVEAGKRDSARFTATNPTSQSITFTITPLTHERIGSPVTLTGMTDTLTPSPEAWYEGYGDLRYGIGSLTKAMIPAETELMTVTLMVGYSNFDADRDYRWDRRFRIYVMDWIDDGDGIPENDAATNELFYVNYGYDTGTTSLATVSFPLSKFQGEPLLWISQRQPTTTDYYYYKGDSDWIDTYTPIPYTVIIKFYQRQSWTWIAAPSSIDLPASSSSVFEASIAVPAGTPQGVYEGLLKVDVTSPPEWARTTIVPVSIVVPAVMGVNTMRYTFSPPSTEMLYDSYRVNGYFDWRWRYEAGDWKMWSFNVQDPTTIAAFVSADWPGVYPSMNDIDLFGLTPQGRITDETGYAWDQMGIFHWDTRTGRTEDWIAIDTSAAYNLGPGMRGPYTVLLHNVLFDGTSFPEPVSGKIELTKLSPRTAVLNIAAGESKSQSFTITTARELNRVWIFQYPYWDSPFPVGLTPWWIQRIQADQSATFIATVNVPSGTAPGKYYVRLWLGADEFWFSVPILIEVNVVEFVSMLSFDDYANRMGMLTPSKPAKVFYFPHFHQDANWETYIAIVNPTSGTATVRLTAYSDTGDVLATRTEAIPGYNKFASLINGVFPGLTGTGWVKVESDVEVIGLLNFDDYGNRMGSLSGVTPASAVYFPHFHQDANWQTYYALVNPSDMTASITITYYRADGTVAGTEDLTLNPRSKTGRFAISGTGWIAVQSDVPIVGMLNFDDYLRRMGSIEHATPSTAIYFPHFQQDASWQTYIAFTNPNPATATVKAIAYSSEGATLASRTITMAGNSKVGDLVNGIFSGLTGTGWISVESNIPIVGLINMDDRANRMGSALAATPQASALFAHFHQDAYWETFYAVVNLGPSLTVTTTYFGSNGVTISATSSTVATNNKIYVRAAVTGMGWIRVAA